MLQSLFAGAALALIALAAPAARANEPGCREECLEARRICHAAAWAANEACHNRCAEAVQLAIERAREACLRQNLGPAECDALIQQATWAAGLACRTDCARLRARALARCSGEIGQCYATCTGLDPACVEQCRGESAECRAELGECARGCAAGVFAGIAECRAQAQQTCTLEGFGACVLEVRRAGARCADECHATFECGGELRECLRICD